MADGGQVPVGLPVVDAVRASFAAQPPEEDDPFQGMPDEQLASIHGTSFSGTAPLDAAARTRTILVVGECGDGKSSLVNALRDPSCTQEAKAGKAARGVTKQINLYRGKSINGMSIAILDTPGIGDKDVTAATLLSMLEGKLSNADAPISGVLVTTPVTDGRVKLGAQVVHALVEKGFVGQAKWDSVILIGTKNDRAEDDERQCFVDEVVPEFFDANGGIGKYAMTSKHDYSALQHQISMLPEWSVKYLAPDAEEMSQALAAKLGIDPAIFQRDLQETRSQIAELVQGLKAQADRMERMERERQAEREQAQERERLLTKELEAAKAREESGLWQPLLQPNITINNDNSANNSSTNTNRNTAINAVISLVQQHMGRFLDAPTLPNPEFGRCGYCSLTEDGEPRDGHGRVNLFQQLVKPSCCCYDAKKNHTDMGQCCPCNIPIFILLAVTCCCCGCATGAPFTCPVCKGTGQVKKEPGSSVWAPIDGAGP